MYLDYVDYLELVRLYDMTDNLASSQPHHLAMFFGQAPQPNICRYTPAVPFMITKYEFLLRNMV